MNKNKWSEKELDQFKKTILKKREEAIADLKKTKDSANDIIENSTSGNIYSSHMADAGTDHQEKEKAYYWMTRENKYIEYLDRAIAMIEEGVFGICKRCSKLISKDRLLEVPHTRSCYECKSQETA